MKDRRFLATWTGEGGREREIGADEGEEIGDEIIL